MITMNNSNSNNGMNNNDDEKKKNSSNKFKITKCVGSTPMELEVHHCRILLVHQAFLITRFQHRVTLLQSFNNDDHEMHEMIQLQNKQIYQ